MSTKKYLIIILSLSALFVGCKKDFDSPPVAELPEGNIITIDSLRNSYNSVDSTFSDDISVYGIVSADEISGNLYKTIYIQDDGAAILLKLTASSDTKFFQGDRVRVALKGTTLSEYRQMIQLQDVDPDVNIIKQDGGSEIQPKVITISDLVFTPGSFTPYQAELIQLDNVEFDCADICNTYADAVNQSSQNVYLRDTLGNSIIVRTSGFASFAGTQLQQGNGSFVGVLSQFEDDLQLTIRKLEDLSLTGTRRTACAPCPVYIHQKDWSDNNLTSGGWTTQYPTPNNLWTTEDISGSNPYAYITNTSGKLVGESWLISPAFDLSATTTPTFNFTSATFNSNSNLSVLISANYDGVSLPSTATWTDITGSLALSTGSWSWTNSGNYILSSFQTNGVYIAFRFNGTAASWDSWELDNFNLYDF